MWDNLDTDSASEQGALAIPIKATCFMSMLGSWFARPLWFFPYFLRSYRLYKIWEV